MTTTSERWERVSRLFAEALDRPRSERAEFLVREERDVEVRGEVEELLHAFEERGASIDAPVRAPLRRDARVGAYRLERHAGEGAMGEVWIARRADDRAGERLAVKLVKRGMDSVAVVRRFERERRILSDLRHDNVARLLDGGMADDGRPYLVMEYVEGVSLDEFCRRHDLSVAERLELVCAVCDGVAAAHARGIVHRDLKPGNVLVTDDRRVKIVDFGIAKVLREEAEGESVLTLTGERLLTPRYASPEQLCGGSVTTASDVYALGVVLYELLVGAPPYDLHGATARELQDIVCDQRAAPVSRAAPRERRAVLRGDLDVIVARALAKEPERRYLDAGALLDDLRRHLAGEPILARLDTLLDHVARFVRRNRRVTAVAVTTMLVLAAAALVSFVFWRRSESAERAARLTTYVSSLRAAEAALRHDQTAAARQLLESAPPDLRGFEWRHLVGRLDTSYGRLETSGNVHVNVVFSPDGAWIASTSYQGFEVRLYGSDGSFLARARMPWNGAANGAARVGFHPREPLLAVPSSGNAVTVFSVPELREERSIELEAQPCQAAWDPSGERLVVALVTGALRVFAHPSYEAVAEVDAHGHGELVLAFDVEGGRLATGSWDETARVWTFPELELLGTYRGHSMGVTGVGFARDGSSLVTASLDRTARVHSLEEPGPGLIFRGTDAPITDLAVDRRDGSVVTCDARGAVYRWDPSTLETLGHYRGRVEATISVAIDSTTGRLAAVGNGPGFLWEADAVGVPRLRTLEYARNLLALTPDESEVFCGLPDGRMLRATLEGLTPLPIASERAAPVRGGGLFAGGAECAAGHEDGRISIWNTRTGELARTVELGVPLGDFEVSRSSGLGVGVGVLEASRTAPVVDLPNGRRVATLSSAEQHFEGPAAWSEARQQVAIPTADRILLFDARSGEIRARIRAEHAPVDALAFDASGTRLAAGSAAAVDVYDVRSGTLSLSMDVSPRVFALAFHPSEPRLVAGLGDGAVCVMDLEHGRDLVSLNGHVYIVGSVLFSADGDRLLTSSDDATVRIWNAAR